MPTATPDVRAALVRAAHAELRERGPGAVSLRAVARRAGLSHAAPGYAFGDRAGLLTAVAVQGFQKLAQTMDEPPAPPGRAGLSELGRRYVAFASADPALYELMFRSSDLLIADEDLQAARAASLQAARAASLQALARLTRTDGESGPPGQVTLISWAFAHGVASLLAGGSLPPDQADNLMNSFAGLVHP